MSVEKALKFSGQLRVLLYKNDVTQTALADGIGVSKQVISKWIAGQSVPDMISFRRIAKFFDVSYDYLYGDTHEKNDWDMKTSFAGDVAVRVVRKKLKHEDIQKKIGINRKFMMGLTSFDSKNDHTPKFSYGRESIQSLSKLCDLLGLNIDDYLILNSAVSPYRADEEAIINAYREKPAMQEAVRKLLDIEGG
jgi:transcriptional regulator with XRE-family HTH domain